MDNFTHSLVGTLVGKAVSDHRKLSPRESKWIISSSIIANNFPDLDGLYAGFLGGKLGYLLHHRGHSHTLFAILGMTLLFGFIAKKWAPKSIFKQLVGVFFLGGCLHVFLDFWNNYGVHPFWPISNKWFYGDFVFILEPFIWMAFLPYLIQLTQSQKWKKGLAAFLIIALALSWGYPLVPVQASILATLWLLVHVAFSLTVKKKYWVMTFSLLIFLTYKIIQSQLLKKTFPGDVIIATPYPANPFCWAILASPIVTNSSAAYEVHRGTYAPYPTFFPANQCRSLSDPIVTVPLVRSRRLDSAQIVWRGSFEKPIAEFLNLRKKSCVFKAFLKFSRSPYWIETPDNNLIIGDIRYDREKELNFAEFDSNTECLSYLPPWEEPSTRTLTFLKAFE